MVLRVGSGFRVQLGRPLGYLVTSGRWGVLLYGGVGFRPRALDVGAFLGCVRFWGFGVRKPP